MLLRALKAAELEVSTVRGAHLHLSRVPHKEEDVYVHHLIPSD